MADLTFIKSLSDEQAAYALKVAQKAEEMGIPKTLALGIAMNESGFNPKVPDSKAGAIGLMQVMPATAKRFGVTARPGQSVERQLRDPETNIRAGTRYLAHLIQLFEGQLELVGRAAADGAQQRPQRSEFARRAQAVRAGLALALEGDARAAVGAGAHAAAEAQFTAVDPGQRRRHLEALFAEQHQRKRNQTS